MLHREQQRSKNIKDTYHLLRTPHLNACVLQDIDGCIRQLCIGYAYVVDYDVQRGQLFTPLHERCEVQMIKKLNLNYGTYRKNGYE